MCVLSCFCGLRAFSSFCAATTFELGFPSVVSFQYKLGRWSIVCPLPCRMRVIGIGWRKKIGVGKLFYINYLSNSSENNILMVLVFCSKLPFF